MSPLKYVHGKQHDREQRGVLPSPAASAEQQPGDGDARGQARLRQPEESWCLLDTPVNHTVVHVWWGELPREALIGGVLINP